MIGSLFTAIVHVLMPSRVVAAAVGGGLVGAGTTYLWARWPRLRFFNIGDPPGIGNRHGQAIWVAPADGSALIDPEGPFHSHYAVAHVAPMNDPDFATSFQAGAPDGTMLAIDVTYDAAMRAAQRHFVRRWLQATLPVPVVGSRRALEASLDLPQPVPVDPAQYEDDIQF
jgi:hypothetical protein